MSREISPRESHKMCNLRSHRIEHQKLVKRLTSKTGPASSMEANLYQFCACARNVTRTSNQRVKRK